MNAVLLYELELELELKDKPIIIMKLRAKLIDCPVRAEGRALQIKEALSVAHNT